jgi:hypothetical protein
VVSADTCPAGQSWNGFGCGGQYLSSDCSLLANQLAEERELMQGQVNPGESLRYRILQRQYEQCMSRFGFGAFGSYEGLFDIP